MPFSQKGLKKTPIYKCQAILLVQDVVQALVDQQAAGYIHGDTKLSNVVAVKGSRRGKHADFQPKGFEKTLLISVKLYCLCKM